jgi:hypothetical protein
MPQDDAIEGHPSTSGFSLPRPNFAHLRSLTDQRGLWEHARYDSPRRDHGFCNDDNARGLVIASREMLEDVTDLAAIYLRYVLDSRRPDGTFRNRRDAAGTWADEGGSDDSQGRGWWGLGAIAARPVSEWMRAPALDAFESAALFVSPHLRANAYAALGAAEIARSHPGFH